MCELDRVLKTEFKLIMYKWNRFSEWISETRKLKSKKPQKLIQELPARRRSSVVTQPNYCFRYPLVLIASIAPFSSVQISFQCSQQGIIILSPLTDNLSSQRGLFSLWLQIINFYRIPIQWPLHLLVERIQLQVLKSTEFRLTIHGFSSFHVLSSSSRLSCACQTALDFGEFFDTIPGHCSRVIWIVSGFSLTNNFTPICLLWTMGNLPGNRWKTSRHSLSFSPLLDLVCISNTLLVLSSLMMIFKHF